MTVALAVLSGLSIFFVESSGAIFPDPAVEIDQRPLTSEQKWMKNNWPGYHNGVNLGGHLVIENWMFMRSDPPFSDAHLQLDYSKVPMYNNNMWSSAMLAQSEGSLRGSARQASKILWCHMDKYYTDAILDEFAEFGINSVRIPVGYWLFDHPELFPDDVWPVPLTTGSKPYGVNPEGFLTPGTLALSNIIVKLWNRNMKVMLDMHALPGCSTPHQSYAGIECAPTSPNFWAGLAEEGISNPAGDVHNTTRAKDGKTWAEVYEKIALERVVPYIEFINSLLPGAVVAYEMMNEPDLLQSDASAEAIRNSTVDLAVDMMTLENVAFGLNDGAHNYPTEMMSDDILEYPQHRDRYWLDVHHYFNWPAMCNVYEDPNYIDIPCVCSANIPDTPHQYEQGAWAEDSWRRACWTRAIVCTLANGVLACKWHATATTPPNFRIQSKHKWCGEHRSCHFWASTFSTKGWQQADNPPSWVSSTGPGGWVITGMRILQCAAAIRIQIGWTLNGGIGASSTWSGRAHQIQQRR